MRGRKRLLNQIDCDKIIFMRRSGLKLKSIAYKYNTSIGTISRVIRGDYKPAVNFWGDREEEVKDSGKSSYPALTQEQCEAIQRDYHVGGWNNQKDLAEIYEVSQGTISRVLNGKYRPISDEEREKLGTLY